MTDRHASPVVAPLGLLADLVEVPPGGIEVEIEMEVDVDVEFLREIEDALEVRVRVGVHVGTAADRLAAVAQRLHQQLVAAGVVGQAFLREDAEGEVDGPGIVALQRLDGLEAAQGNARVDLDMGPHARRAVHDGAFEHFCAARVDVLDRKVLLHSGHGADRVRDAAVIVPAAAEQASLVEMDVGIDEPGQGEAPADIDLDGLAGKSRLDRGDAAALHADIDGCGG
ncbi:hypothetical protein ABIF86_002493 [Bradyrhizobium japonicum]